MFFFLLLFGPSLGVLAHAIIYPCLQGEEIIGHSLNLFFEMASGLVLFLYGKMDLLLLVNSLAFFIQYYATLCRYTIGKLLLKLDTVRFIVSHHSVIII